MRKPDRIEQLYLDFDGFFASVEQQARPALRGRPIGVVPFSGSEHTVIIACSREAKAQGIKNIMPVSEVRKICPDILLVPQSPDLYRRAHNALIAEISCLLPIEAIKSIDELTCRIAPKDAHDPYPLGQAIKRHLAKTIGSHITCSIGFAANRQLAKIALKRNKPDGITIWRPEDMPSPLFACELDDIPGIGRRLKKRLEAKGIDTVKALYNTAPKQMRHLWNNVTGERLWYALHGYDIRALPSERSLFGHGRVLPPDQRSPETARACSRLLLSKASRRLRRGGFYARALSLWIAPRRPFNHLYPQTRRDYSWSYSLPLPSVNDELACLQALDSLWEKALPVLGSRDVIVRLSVALHDLVEGTARQLDLFLHDDPLRRKHEALTSCLDHINSKYAETLLSYGVWSPPKNGYAGGKIAFTRIPDADDFY